MRNGCTQCSFSFMQAASTYALSCSMQEVACALSKTARSHAVPGDFQAKVGLSICVLLEKTIRNIAMKDPTQCLWNTKVDGGSNQFVDEFESLGAISEYPTTNQVSHGGHGLSRAEVDDGVQP